MDPTKRLRNALRVLRGQSVTPQQMHAQWIEYQVVFDGILDKLNVALARLAKREQREAKRLLEALAADPTETTTPGEGETSIQERKAVLRRRVWESRGLAPHAALAGRAPAPENGDNP